MQEQHFTAAAHHSAGPVAGWSWAHLLLALVVALFTYGNAWISLGDTRFGVPPDEWAHATYVHEIAAEGRLVPDYAGSRILPGRERGNYLNHPPLYYTVLGLAGRAMQWDVVDDHRQYRKLSAAMVALGMLVWMLVGGRLGMPLPWLLAAAAATNAVPMFPFLAGSINNDNMAFLGVAIAFLGLVQLRHWPRAAFHLGALGVLVVFLTKATAALFLCAFFASWAVAQWRARTGLLRSRHLLAAAAALGLVAGAWYGYALLAHGSPFPRAMALYTPDPPSEPLPLGPFAVEFARAMAARLPTIMSHASLSPLVGPLRWVFWIMLAAPLLAWLVTLRRTRGTPDGALAKMFALALAITLLIHVLVVWRDYQHNGLMAGMQPRYYNYALPGLFVFAFLQARESRLGKLLFAAFALSASLLLAVAPSLATRAQMQQAAAPPASKADAVRVRYPAASEAPVLARIGGVSGHGGHVDALEVSGGAARIRGWAIDRRGRTPARGVLVVVGDRLLGSIGTGHPRPDVARALGAARATGAGFAFTIDDLPDGIAACDIRLVAEQDDGSLASLTHAACPGWAP